jgi:RND family efflux transporter MFP subunit
MPQLVTNKAESFVHAAALTHRHDPLPQAVTAAAILANPNTTRDPAAAALIRGTHDLMIHRSESRRTTPPVAAGATLLLLATGFLAGGCGSGASPRGTVHDAADPVTVQAIRAGDAGAFGGLILPGRVRAREEVTLAARITGRLTALPMREGASFRRGQVLARFDAPETRDAVRSAREALEAARARVEQARADETRMQTLVEQNVAARRDLELAGVERHAAEAAFSSAQAALQSWEENAALTAPFDGVVARRHVDPGQTLTPGQPILDLRSRTVGEIEAAVPESALPTLATARASYQISDGDWNAATLVRVDGMTDPATRTRRAYFAPEAQARLEAGAYARVRIRAAAGDSAVAAGPIVVPSSALVRRGSLTGVYVLRDDRAWLRWLRIGREADGRAEVLAGLAPGEAFAAAPADLADGRAVRIAE